MKPFIKVNDNEIIGTSGNINFINIDRNQKIEIQYSNGGVTIDNIVPDEHEKFSFEELEDALKAKFPNAWVAVHKNFIIMGDFKGEALAWLRKYYYDKDKICEYPPKGGEMPDHTFLKIYK